jgi:hypothetical protein
MKHKAANNTGTSLELDAAAGLEVRPSLLPTPDHPGIFDAVSKYSLVMSSSHAVRVGAARLRPPDRGPLRLQLSTWRPRSRRPKFCKTVNA